MLENMLLPQHCMQVYPFYCLDLPLAGLVIELVSAGLKIVVTVVVVLVVVENFVAEMAWIMDMQNSVAEMAWIVDIFGIVGMEMVVDIVAGIVVGIVEVADFHNHILSNLMQVGFDIVVEAEPAMELEYSKNFEVDTDSFVEGIFVDFVEESLVSKVFSMPHSRNLLFLTLLPLDSFAIPSTLDSFLLNDFMYKDHTLEHYPKDILLMHVSFYIWDKRLLKFVLVILSFCLLLEHLLVSQCT